ncbi:flavin-containing monooxygenase FMO GS-OX5-like [Mizuhopecten yessoensis]|uniref:Flavin-containing monooxygenase n=1 Tax=Mizuhopecten yessoensis TaxID=6573 RepID=A0A210QH34_MIZYE|nr:flavin-containing monooxygenase FMO GS-OX5-like [Mizuhopecten yessoensis]OWF48026.1 Flavin-containing monooxygenase FMO GS-OX-like 1 [Mizuhopecten yessoensis]
MTIRVAVIGAGAAGLCALRHLTTRQYKFRAVCFEQNSRLGGTWIYTDKTGVDDHGLPIHSSMYKNLTTNLPKELMAFPDFPFRGDLPSYVRHGDVLEYLESYADQFDLFKYIKFSTTVIWVEPLTSPDKVTWQVTYKALSDSVVTPVTENFDAVMVCNGHFAVPILPAIPGLDLFQGKAIHSHNYRYPAEFEGKLVVCLGAGASGISISVDVSTTAKQVYMCHRKPSLPTCLPDNVEQKPGVKNVTEHTVVFENGEEVTVDALLFCTGYRFSFPFLSPECHLTTENERIVPLYKHLIHTEYPSLSLIGITKIICPFLNFHHQVLFVIATLDGTITLPSRKNMDEDTAKDFSNRLKGGMPERYAHTMGPLQWRYYDEIADLVGSKRIPPVFKELYETVMQMRNKDFVNLKSFNYKISGPNTYVTSNDNLAT